MVKMYSILILVYIGLVQCGHCYIHRVGYPYFPGVKRKEGLQARHLLGDDKTYEQEPFQLKPLPFGFNDLSPAISEETIKFHYLKHHSGYVRKLNALSLDNPEIATKSILDLVKTSDGLVFNMAAQVWNHDFYWECLSPTSNLKDAPLVEREITSSFGSFGDFQQKLKKVVTEHFGSGWVWLLYDKKALQTLKLVATKDAENPIRKWALEPLLVIDVWEHAYYIDYRNERDKYVSAWLSKVNWKRIESLFKQQQQGLTLN